MAIGTLADAKGKRVYIKHNGVEFNAILDEDISLNISSSFGDLFPAFKHEKLFSKAGNVLGSIAGKKYQFSAKNKHSGFQVWENSEPLSFALNLGFYASSDAYANVYKPMIMLAGLPLPTEITGGFLRPPGPVFSLTDRKTTVTDNKKSPKGKTINTDNSEVTYIKIGEKIIIKQAILTKANPTFSSEVDSAGYPIWGKLTIDVQTTTTATRGLIYSFLKPADRKPK